MHCEIPPMLLATALTTSFCGDPHAWPTSKYIHTVPALNFLTSVALSL